MKGYVMNTSTIWTHAMKRSIGPGAKVPLNELFEQYGAKHGIETGNAFVEWLRTVKLKDTNKWRIVVEEDTVEGTSPPVEKEAPRTKISNDGVTPMVSTKLEVIDVVGFSVRQAREQLPKIKDLNLLKYALQEANQLAGKDSLCKVIRKRIKDLQIAR